MLKLGPDKLDDVHKFHWNRDQRVSNNVSELSIVQIAQFNIRESNCFRSHFIFNQHAFLIAGRLVEVIANVMNVTLQQFKKIIF
jgi:hypothetical protein